MRIGISTRGLHQGSFAISSIIYHLAQTIVDRASGEHEVFLYFNHPNLESLFDETAHKRSIKMPNRFIWDHAWLPQALSRDRIEVALFMKGTLPLTLPCRGAMIIHDMGYFDDQLQPYRYLETIYMKKMMAWSSRKAFRIFADSAYTRNQVITYLDIDPQKVTVCYQNCSSNFRPVIDAETLQAVKSRYNLPSNYIFCPTSLSPRKNLNRILSAFEHVKHQFDHHLVITGGQSWRVKNLDQRIQNEPDRRVHILGTVQQDHMPALYSLASFTLYTSLLEGFGLPILESFRCGCPVLTSNVTSMPEVAGEAAYMVDPYDVSQIAAGMIKLATDEAMRQEYIQKGFERAKRFSWERTAGIILEQLVGCPSYS